MGLTQRRMEFLEKIIAIFRRTRLPVHYETIGKELGVSKWTAYDILKRLEDDGFLRSEYMLSPDSKNAGRSMIVFYPTEKGLKNIEDGGETQVELSKSEELYRVREKLMGLVEKMRQVDSKKIIKDLLDEIPEIEVPVVFGAYTIALLIAGLHTSSIVDPKVAKNLLQNGIVAPEVALSFFAGMSLGVILKNMKGFLNEAIVPYIVKFQDYISSYDRREKEFLLRFLTDALRKGE